MDAFPPKRGVSAEVRAALVLAIIINAKSDHAFR